VVQLEGHAIQEILGGADLQPEQLAVVMDGVATPPAAEQSLDLGGRSVVVVHQAFLQHILHKAVVIVSDREPTPPPLDCNGRLSSVLEHLPVEVSSPS